MKRIAIMVLSVIMALTSYIPAQAFPTISTVTTQKAKSANLLQIRDRRHYRGHGGWRGNRHWRGDRRYYGRHYRRNNAGAIIGGLAAGAIIGGALSSQARASSGSSHVNYCYNRYRSYRASDNTYQPYSGPRRQCVR